MSQAIPNLDGMAATTESLSKTAITLGSCAMSRVRISTAGRRRGGTSTCLNELRVTSYELWDASYEL